MTFWLRTDIFFNYALNEMWWFWCKLLRQFPPELVSYVLPSCIAKASSSFNLKKMQRFESLLSWHVHPAATFKTCKLNKDESIWLISIAILLKLLHWSYSLQAFHSTSGRRQSFSAKFFCNSISLEISWQNFNQQSKYAMKLVNVSKASSSDLL